MRCKDKSTRANSSAITGVLVQIEFHGTFFMFLLRSNWPISFFKYAFSFSLMKGCVLGLLLMKIA